MTESSDSKLAESMPCLVPGVEFIDFSPVVEYLKDPKTHTYLKLKKEDGALVRQFTGKRTLAEILRGQLETSGTTQYQRMLSLLILLNQHGLLTSGSTSFLQQNFFIFEEKNIISRCARFLAQTFAFDLVDIRAAFDSPILKRGAQALASMPGLLILTLIVMANNFFPPVHRGVRFEGLLSGAVQAGDIGPGIYILTLVGVWVSACVILSLKDLLTAYVLTSHRCAVVRPRIRFYAGLILFDCDPIDIVSAGKSGVIRMYGFRILLPFALFTAVSFLSSLGVTSMFLSLFKEACMLVAVVGILPLAHTDMNRALGKLGVGTSSFDQSLTFLRKRYVSHLFSFKRMAVHGLHRSNIMVISTVIWLAISCLIFQQHLGTRYKYILDTLGPGFSWSALLMLTQLLILLAPFVVLTVLAFSIALSNARVIIRAPARRFIHAAETIARRPVPVEGEIIKFLNGIPLFAHLETENLRRLCSFLKLVRYGSQHTIILQGERGDAFYIIVSGMVVIEVEDEYGQLRIVDTLTTGHSFGEIALMENIPRTATVRAVTPVSLFVLDRKQFGHFVHDWTGGKERITDIIRTSRLLMSSPLFVHLSPTELRALIGRFETHLLAPGTVIFNQDDPGDRMFLIREGKVEIQHVENGKTVFSKVLETGDWLGEIALVKGLARTATATAVDRSVVLSLSRTDFYGVMQNSILTGIEFNRLAEQRLDELRTRTLA